MKKYDGIINYCFPNHLISADKENDAIWFVQKPYKPTGRSESIPCNWKTFENDEKYFLFHRKSSFCSKDN